MPQFDRDLLKKKKRTMKALDEKFNYWEHHYRQLSDYILPRRYDSVYDTSTENEANRGSLQISSKIYDGTGTKALRRMAHGMVGAIASPTRKWFQLKLHGVRRGEAEKQTVRRYLDSVELSVAETLSESNFYETIGTMFEDLGCFGTTAAIGFPDPTSIVRFQISPVGEFRIAQDTRRRVHTFSRVIKMTVEQMIREFGEENCSRKVREAWEKGGDQHYAEHDVCHLIEPWDGNEFVAQELYFESACQDALALRVSLHEVQRLMVPRWQLKGSDTYGTSPGMDALPDIRSLQQITLRKGELLDKITDPALQYDSSMQQIPSLAPGTRVAVPHITNSAGVKPIYEASGQPMQAIVEEIGRLAISVREFFYNDLFEQITRLQTVRSATEIDAREQEKLILLGPVVGRLAAETLAPAIALAIFELDKLELLPEDVPAEVREAGFAVQFDNIFVAAQRALSAGPMERFFQVVGQLGSVYPEARNLLDAEEAIREYGIALNVPATILRSREETKQLLDAEARNAAAQQRLEQDELAAKTNKLLAEGQPTAGLVPGP